MNLYSVSFTTQKLIKKLDAKGKIIAETRMDTPVTIGALPHATAMSYSHADNFKIEQYVPDARRKAGSGRDGSVGNGTKRVSYARESSDTGSVRTIKTKPVSRVSSDATTGNMAGAINH